MYTCRREELKEGADEGRDNIREEGEGKDYMCR
jgi:hypothetical protein